MINEKIICETIVSMLDKMGQIAGINAGILAILSKKIPSLSETEQQTLSDGSHFLLDQEKNWQDAAKKLKDTL